MLSWFGLNLVSSCSDFSQMSQTFEELMALAEAGHEDNLNVRTIDVVSAVEGDSYTDALLEEMVIYSFGKAHGKDLGT